MLKYPIVKNNFDVTGVIVEELNTKQQFKNGGLGCTTVLEYVENVIDFPCAENNHFGAEGASECSLEGDGLPYSVITGTWVSVQECGGTDTSCKGCGPGGSGSGSGSVGGGPGSTGGSTGKDDGGIITTPVTLDLNFQLLIKDLTEEQQELVAEMARSILLDDLKTLYKESGYSAEAANYIKGQLEIEAIEKKRTFNFSPRQGKINNRDDQAYTHIAFSGNYTMYAMEDGSKILESPNQLILDSDGHFNVYNETEVTNYKYHYIKLPGEKTWSRYLLKDPSSTSDELKLLFTLGAREGVKTLARYVLPIEDFKILIDGKDFDGNQVSRWQAAGGIILAVVPGGVLVRGGSKVIKAVTKITRTEKYWYVVVKQGNKVYTRIVNELTAPTIAIFNNYANNVTSLIDDALRSGKYTDDVIEEAAEVVEDISRARSRKLTWSEVKELFKRGNDFNKKARSNEWYDFHEIHLANGKRLDSYDDVAGEIISRKATDLGNIKFATFEKYLKEFSQKYSVGTRIRSNKYLDELDGKLLEGTYILEIPSSNQTLSNIQSFIYHAWDNYRVKIRFRPE